MPVYANLMSMEMMYLQKSWGVSNLTHPLKLDQVEKGVENAWFLLDAASLSNKA